MPVYIKGKIIVVMAVANGQALVWFELSSPTRAQKLHHVTFHFLNVK